MNQQPTDPMVRLGARGRAGDSPAWTDQAGSPAAPQRTDLTLRSRPVASGPSHSPARLERSPASSRQLCRLPEVLGHLAFAVPFGWMTSAPRYPIRDLRRRHSTDHRPRAPTYRCAIQASRNKIIYKLIFLHKVRPRSRAATARRAQCAVFTWHPTTLMQDDRRSPEMA